MAVAVEEDFESWLSCKLKALNTDEGVFGSYITGILDGEETLEEKNEALEGILVDITVRLPIMVVLNILFFCLGNLNPFLLAFPHFFFFFFK